MPNAVPLNVEQWTQLRNRCWLSCAAEPQIPRSAQTRATSQYVCNTQCANGKFHRRSAHGRMQTKIMRTNNEKHNESNHTQIK